MTGSTSTTVDPPRRAGVAALAPPGARPRRRKLSQMRRREERWFYVCLIPWIIGFIVFGGGPLIGSIVLSLTDYSLLSSPAYVGLDNYRRLVEDPVFYKSMVNTVYFGAGSVALSIVSTLLLALLLNQDVRMRWLFRTIFYLPAVVAGIATALLWKNILNPDFGFINLVLGWVGIQGPGWLQSSNWAIPGLILMSVWGAGNMLVIHLAGLQSIPRTQYEAAEIDGANAVSRFWHVTIPMMSPVIFFNVITGLIASLQAYVLILVMTGTSANTSGGPENSTLVIGLYIYREAFQYFDFGYAAALSWALFAFIMIITGVQFAFARRWVYYEGG